LVWLALHWLEGHLGDVRTGEPWKEELLESANFQPLRT